MRDLYRIHPLLDLKTSVLLANALVSSGLDYCYSLFLSLTDFYLRRLQLVQNSARLSPVPQNCLTLHLNRKTSLAPSQEQGTIQNRPHYIQNPQPRSPSLPKRINSPLHLFQIKNSPSISSFRKHLKTQLFNSSFKT